MQSYFNQFVDHCRKSVVYFLHHSRTSPRFTRLAKKKASTANFKLKKFQDKAAPPLTLLKHTHPISRRVLQSLNNYIECINKSISRNDRLAGAIIRHHRAIRRIEQAKKDKEKEKKAAEQPNSFRKRHIYYPRYFSRNYYYPKSLFYQIQQNSKVLPQGYQLVLNTQTDNIQGILEELVGLGYELNTYLKKQGYRNDDFSKSKQTLKRYQYLFRMFSAKVNQLQTDIQKIKGAYPAYKNALPSGTSQKLLTEALELGKPVMNAARQFMQNNSQELMDEKLAKPLIRAFANQKTESDRQNHSLKSTLRSVKYFTMAAESIAQAKGKYRVSAQTIQNLYYKYNGLIKKFNKYARTSLKPVLKKIQQPKVLTFNKVGYTPCDCGDGNDEVDMTSMQGFAHNNLMLLLDVSGSMKDELQMLKNALKYLVNIMRPQDDISVVVFGSEAKLMLRPTSAKNKAQIMRAIDTLKSSGRTNGEAGLRLAYEWIQNNYKSKGNNRIILATDGEFTLSSSIYSMIEEKAGENISLSVFSFADQLNAFKKLKKLVALGKGNYEVVTDGNAAYKIVREAQSKKMPGQKTRRIKTNPQTKPCDCDSQDTVQIIQPKIKLITKKDTATVVTKNNINMTSMQGFAHNNLMLLLDVSGSMAGKDKLPLLKESFKYLVNIMRAEDDVSIVIYAGDAAIVLKPTSASNQEQINAVIDKLRSRGKTNVKAGFKLAYKWMSKNFKEGGNNRIILATDGEFPISKYIYKLVEKRAERGINLSVFSFGSIRKKFDSLQTLVNKGKGNYEHVDKSKGKYKLVKEAQSKQIK